LPLRAIANLKVGDVLRLGLPLDERARVSAGGAELFQGRPTASGDVVAVALERQIA
jgi:flagellar motor switch protein FliM